MRNDVYFAATRVRDCVSCQEYVGELDMDFTIRPKNNGHYGDFGLFAHHALEAFELARTLLDDGVKNLVD